MRNFKNLKSSFPEFSLSHLRMAFLVKNPMLSPERSSMNTTQLFLGKFTSWSLKAVRSVAQMQHDYLNERTNDSKISGFNARGISTKLNSVLFCCKSLHFFRNAFQACGSSWLSRDVLINSRAASKLKLSHSKFLNLSAISTIFE